VAALAHLKIISDQPGVRAGFFAFVAGSALHGPVRPAHPAGCERDTVHQVSIDAGPSEQIMTTPPADLSANAARFAGCGDVYDASRPSPPPALLDILMQLAEAPRPALVVDLGSGTGLSTAIWASRAAEVVGVEPSGDMRRQAEARSLANVRYLAGYANATGMPDGCADIVTCAQSLHWMEPVSTFAEIARILRNGGVFAAYDYDWPPTIGREVEQAHQTFAARMHQAERSHALSRDVRYWDKHSHLERMRESGLFRATREILLEHVEQGGAERFIGLELSQGGVATLLKNGVSEDEIGITALRESARRLFGKSTALWHFSYRARVGVK
jgi:SAM-dependent methyltransferase